MQKFKIGDIIKYKINGETHTGKIVGYYDSEQKYYVIDNYPNTSTFYHNNGDLKGFAYDEKGKRTIKLNDIFSYNYYRNVSCVEMDLKLKYSPCNIDESLNELKTLLDGIQNR